MRDKLQQFVKLIDDQFTYGGKKYALTTTKESTDMLFDIHGYRWLVGTMHKYIFRYTNLARERDLLKIATYCYIMWLKRGFHLGPRGTKNVIDTTVEIKSKYFNVFIDDVLIQDVEELPSEGRLDTIGHIFSVWSRREWYDITEEDLFKVFHLCYAIWESNYSDKEVHDTDTYNTTDKQR